MKHILLILPLLLHTAVCMGREWKTASGSLSFEAEFVCYCKGHIAVQLPGGKYLNYPEQAFSDADIQYAKEHQSEEDRKTDETLKLIQKTIEKLDKEIKENEEKRKRNLERVKASKKREAVLKGIQRRQYAYDLASWLVPRVRSGHTKVMNTRNTLAMYQSFTAHWVVGRLQTINGLNHQNLQIYNRLADTANALYMKENPTQGWLESQQKLIQVLLEDATKNEKQIDKELDSVQMIAKPIKE